MKSLFDPQENFGPVNFPVMVRAGSASSTSNPLIRINDFSFTCLPYRSDHRKIYRTKYFAELGVDYDFTNGEGNWWELRMLQERLQQQE